MNKFFLTSKLTILCIWFFRRFLLNLLKFILIIPVFKKWEGHLGGPQALKKDANNPSLVRKPHFSCPRDQRELSFLYSIPDPNRTLLPRSPLAWLVDKILCFMRKAPHFQTMWSQPQTEILFSLFLGKKIPSTFWKTGQLHNKEQTVHGRGHTWAHRWRVLREAPLSDRIRKQLDPV